jgi:hypothetical protein
VPGSCDFYSVIPEGEDGFEYCPTLTPPDDPDGPEYINGGYDTMFENWQVFFGNGLCCDGLCYPPFREEGCDILSVCPS